MVTDSAARRSGPLSFARSSSAARISSARADLTERLRAVAVARGRDRHERNLDAVAAQMARGQLGLREREPTAAGADAYQHGTACVRPWSARTAGAA